MSHETLAMVLWLMLALSIALTLVGLAARASWPLYLAAALSVVFGIVAIFSIGIFVLVLVLIQLALAFAYRRQSA